MDIERRRTKQPQRHRGALDVPSRTALAARHVPRRLAFFRGLPDDEVARILLGVFVDVDTRARLHPLVVEPRQFAVVVERADLEVDGSVAAIRVAVLLEREHHVAHRPHVQVVGRPRRFFGCFDAERGGILAEGANPLFGVLAQRHLRRLRARDRLVVDVGVVDHLSNVMPGVVPQRAAEHVEADERPEIADVATGVDGEAAGVHPDGVVAQRSKRLFLACQRVVETKHESTFRAASGEPRRPSRVH